MLRLLILLSKICLIVCGMNIGVLCTYGFDWLMLMYIILSIVMHYVYLIFAGRCACEHSPFKITQLKAGDPKPDEMPEEIWNQLQGLLQYTADEEGDNNE